jgi:DNA polymerase-1
MPRKLLLVDAPNHAFRAYHAIQSDMRAPDGFPTRALYGFTRILLNLVRDHKPDYVAFVFDVGTSFRNALYPDYKGQRPDMPEDLRQQWGELRPLIEAFGFTVLAEPDTEADDVIGTLARRFANEDVHVGIVSGDKDFCQLVNDHIRVVDLLKGIELGPPEVTERWGVGPDRIIDLLSLMGDTSDNVPGVPGVGEKKAAQFLQKYGDLEGVLANCAGIGGKTGQAVSDNAEAVRLARKLVTIHTELPITVALEDLAPKPRNEAELRARLGRWNFRTLMNDLGLGAPAPAATGMVPGWQAADCPAIWGPGAIAALIERLRGVGRIALHVATNGEDPLASSLLRLSFAWEADGGVRLARVPLDAANTARIAPLLADAGVAKVVYDAKDTLKALRTHGLSLAGLAGDPMIADYLLVPEQKRTLDDLCRRYLERPLGDDPGEEAHAVLLIDRVLSARLEQEGEERVYREIELPLVAVLAEMEIAGIGVDRAGLAELSAVLETRLASDIAEIHRLAGEEFNLNSTQQLATILFEKLGLKGGKKTKFGWSTDADTLDKLRDEHPLPAAILAYRETFKLKNTYVDALPGYIRADGRIHTNFRQTVAATGRLSSLDPNLQNIPIRTDEGRRIRRCFVARDGHLFVSADYSQIELRILAHYCGEGPLVESFVNNEDIHRRTASEIFGVMPALVTADQRRAAKAINFGIVYGMGPARLANDLRIPRGEAQSYIDGYFRRYPQVRAYMNGAIARARERGFAETLYGRRRPVAGLDAGNPMDRSAAERVAINTPIQGSAADLIKLAMLRVVAAVPPERARLLLQVHDELVFEVPTEHVESVRREVTAAMESVASLKVPLKVDSGASRTWDEAH